MTAKDRLAARTAVAARLVLAVILVWLACCQVVVEVSASAVLNVWTVDLLRREQVDACVRLLAVFSRTGQSATTLNV